ncbi:hypothetical protein O1611_g1529 [Lasiodiplodia mahajangana]|uniref:Uncharacterized protein n=1 Tax=Lasiodiplodia mahajangana TaxID=1108764 RepID=A0ACC2JX56_9PEZI|nr:hypothetical protein O1611_g1529 [Lasiodiplodia mahajangana]
MNTQAGRRKASSISSHASPNSQGSEDIFQDARKNWDTDSEPSLLSNPSPPTTQACLENQDLHVLNIRKSLPVLEGQQSMSNRSNPTRPTTNQWGDSQCLRPNLVEETSCSIDQEAENQGSKFLDVPKTSFASPSRPFARDYLVSKVRGFLGSNSSSSKPTQQFRGRIVHTCEVVHRRPGRGNFHEKTNPEIAAKVHNVLSPPTNELVRNDLYEADASTAWFGA